MFGHGVYTVGVMLFGIGKQLGKVFEITIGPPFSENIANILNGKTTINILLPHLFIYTIN